MADPMRMLGVGSRSSVLVMVAMLSGMSACSSREAGARADHTASTAESTREPAQVVRSMMGTAPSGAPATESSAAAMPKDARASAAGVARANGDARAPGRGGETITSKHLEAELNRLEAELAN